MTVAIMQPYLFPYIGYFQLANSVDKFIILDDANYINKGWINRNTFLQQGNVHKFTVPLKEASQNKLIKDLSIFEGDKWRKKFYQTIVQSYNKSPNYYDAILIVKRILDFEGNLISEFIYHSLVIILEYLDVKTAIVPSSIVYANTNLKGQDRIIDICLRESATNYINPMGGAEIYEKAVFTTNGITLQFLKPSLITYKQFSEVFIPNLSIIDVIMFNRKEKVKQFLNAYSLI